MIPSKLNPVTTLASHPPAAQAAHFDSHPYADGAMAKPSRRGEQRPLSRIALDEHELATRWGLSVKTLRRWRQQQLGPVFCKLGSRVTYLLSEIEAFEKRASRYSTSARVTG